jgi:hypothetical protein
LVHVDRAVNYVPFFSTFSNLINLPQKCFFIPCMNKEFIRNNHYYTYLDQKSFLSFTILLIPLIGNLIFSISGFVNISKYNDRHSIFAYQENSVIVGQGNPKTEVESIIVDPMEIDVLSESPNKSMNDVLKAVRENGLKIATIGKYFTNNYIVVKDSVKQNGLALEFVSKQMHDNYHVVLIAVKKNPNAIRFASPRLQEIPELKELAQ